MDKNREALASQSAVRRLFSEPGYIPASEVANSSPLTPEMEQELYTFAYTQLFGRPPPEGSREPMYGHQNVINDAQSRPPLNTMRRNVGDAVKPDIQSAIQKLFTGIR